MPSPDDAPSRRDFENLAESVKLLTRTIQELPDKMAATYVRKDVYDSDKETHKQVHKDQSDDINGLKSARDWVVKIFLAAIFMALIGLVIIGR